MLYIGPPVNIKTLGFNLRFLCPFLHGFWIFMQEKQAEAL